MLQTSRLASYLEHPDSYSDDGWLVLAGKTYPGYAKYPFVATVQQVCAHYSTCLHSQSSDASHPSPSVLLQRKTVRISGKTTCDEVLSTSQPEVRERERQLSPREG